MPQFPNDYPAYDKASKDIENDKILIDQDGTTKAAKISDISGGGISQNYSTSEIALRNSDGTPLLWIDGKQVYQKSYLTSTSISDALGIDTPISTVGFYLDDDWYTLGTFNTRIPQINALGTFNLNTTRRVIVTIRYTKI